MAEKENQTDASGFTETGYLSVCVRTAGGALPIEGAIINIKSIGNNSVNLTLYSDNSGLSSLCSLPAPQKSNSETPSPSGVPYSDYVIEVYKKGYYRVITNHVPIYAGITSIQPVDLVPLADFEITTQYQSETREYNITPPNL